MSIHAPAARLARLLRPLIVTVSAALAWLQPAGAVDKIYSPQVVRGEGEFEYFGTRTVDADPGKNDLQEHEISIGYGVTDWWWPELYTILQKPADESLRATGVQLENRFQLAPPGKYWVDAGLLVAYTRALHQDDPDTLEVKLLLEKLIGRTLYRVNIGGEQEFGHDAHSAPDRVLLWSTRYLLDRRFAPGLEIQSDFGRANEARTFAEQEHYVGPAAYGELVPHLKYEVAYLFGASSAASKGAWRLLIEYEAFF